MTDVDTQLCKAVLDAEKVSSVFRLLVFSVLALAMALAFGERGADGLAASAAALYGLGTAVGLVLAWRGLHHPAVPYGFVTFDVALIAIQTLALAGMMGMPATSVYALPTTSLIFVILIHASMRYQPALVAYAAVLFIGTVQLGTWLAAETSPSMAMEGMAGMPGWTQSGGWSHSGVSGVVIFDVAPPALVLLAAAILFVIGRRTRMLLLSSIRHATRTATLSRYFSPRLAARLADSESSVLAGRRQPAAVLFVDIRGFTSLGETMPPDDLGRFLSEYRDRLTRPVFQHGGMVDKFIGDAIMAVFGTPEPKQADAASTLACAREILRVTERWSDERVRAGKPPVQIGIGSHYGEVFAGALGTDQLLEYTVIGDTVNVAERLERLSRDVDRPLVVSKALLEAAGNAKEQGDWTPLPPQQLKGHKRPVEAYCLESRESLGGQD